MSVSSALESLQFEIERAINTFTAECSDKDLAETDYEIEIRAQLDALEDVCSELRFLTQDTAYEEEEQEED